MTEDLPIAIILKTLCHVTGVSSLFLHQAVFWWTLQWTILYTGTFSWWTFAFASLLSVDSSGKDVALREGLGFATLGKTEGRRGWRTMSWQWWFGCLKSKANWEVRKMNISSHTCKSEQFSVTQRGKQLCGCLVPFARQFQGLKRRVQETNPFLD